VIPIGEWELNARLERAPVELRTRMLAALGDSGSTAGGDPRGLVLRLRRAADRLLDQALQGPPTPETAVTLLASDGLATLACEVLAVADPGALAQPD
jgi:hypothetical protein